MKTVPQLLKGITQDHYKIAPYIWMELRDKYTLKKFLKAHHILKVRKFNRQL